MGFEISYREHRIYANPATIVWSKPTATLFRGRSTPNLSQGRWYMFFVVDRAWLNGKYIRWRWLGQYSWTFATYAQIWDGEYDRSSMVDFPDQAGPISKGNGTLQTLDQNSGTFAMETKDIQADTSGGSEEKCTVIFWASDSWSGQTGWYDLDWIEINSGAGGAGPISNEQFTDNIIAEQTGTTADYGYIGYGRADPVTLDLLAMFFVTHIISTARDLLGEFVARRDATRELLAGLMPRRSNSQDLPVEIRVRNVGGVNLLGRFSVRQSDLSELLGEFSARRSASTELKAEFWVQFYGVDLLAIFYIRPAGSRATDFQVKDRTRGLTIHDPDRVMTVTPRRKMRVR